jgi:CheY-like chemotaxis protein
MHEEHKIEVLVVDDEPIAREVTSWWLESSGYRVTAAASASEALSIMATRRFDVLVSDVMLNNGPDGFELAVAASERQRDLRVIFVSAQAWGPSQAEDPDTTFLHKPFSRTDLARAVRFALDEVTG